MSARDSHPGQLVLATGEVFSGRLWGEPSLSRMGEIVFSTAMTGYQEMLTDPSYCEQVLVATTAHLGNTGINTLDQESHQVQTAAFVVNALTEQPSSWRSEKSLDQWLAEAKVPLLSDVETRRLTLRLRDKGAIKGWVGSAREPLERVRAALKDQPEMVGRNLVDVVSTKKSYTWSEGTWRVADTVEDTRTQEVRAHRSRKYRVAVMDFGVKFSILRRLVDRGCELKVFPALASAADVLAFQPDGIFLSNGPGDPAACEAVIRNLKELLGKKPTFGICMGHQILAHALGARTFKLPFGHRGANHPVKDLRNGRVEVTSQNHGFAVDADSLPAHVIVTHRSLNDGTVEGLACAEQNAFSVQYHPEASPGPHDSFHLFDQFLEKMNV